MTARAINSQRGVTTALVINAIHSAGTRGLTVPQIKAALNLPHKETVTRIIRRLRGAGIVARWQRGTPIGRYSDVRYVLVG